MPAFRAPPGLVDDVTHTGLVRLGLDYSGGRPSGRAVRAAGYTFVVRYLPNGLSGRVNISAAEVADMRANGVDVVLVWERKIIGQPDRATAGYNIGVADAAAAQTQAVICGLGDLPIYMAVDFDIPDYAPGNPDPRAKLGPVGDYLAGAASVLGRARTGVYGGYYAVKRALDAGLVSWAWQTAAWSGGQVDKDRINLFQRIGTVPVDGVDCDVNEARTDEFGQHSPEDDVTEDDIKALIEYPIQREGSTLTGATSIKAVIAWFDAAVQNIQGAVTKAVDGLRTEMDAKLAAISTPAAPEIDYDKLGASIVKEAVAAGVHLNTTVVADKGVS